jgi:hypothetical protein
MLGNPRSGSKAWKALDRAVSEGKTARPDIIVAYTKTFDRGSFHHRRIAAIFGPACAFHTCIQFFSSDCDRPHGVLRQVIAELRPGLLEDPAQAFYWSEVSQ